MAIAGNMGGSKGVHARALDGVAPDEGDGEVEQSHEALVVQAVTVVATREKTDAKQVVPHAVGREA